MMLYGSKNTNYLVSWAFFVVLGLLALPDFKTAQAMPFQAPWSLQQSVEYALNTNPEIFAAIESEHESSHLITQARSRYFPSVDFLYGYGREKSLTTSNTAYLTMTRLERRLSITENVFDGLNTTNLLHRAKAQTASAHYQALNQMQLISYGVIQAHLNVLRFSELLYLSSINVHNHESTLAKVYAKYKGGAGNKADYDLARSRLALAKSVYAQAKESLGNAIENYYRLVGVKPQKLLMPKLKPQYFPIDLPQAIKRGLQSHPALKATELTAIADNYQVKAAYGTYSPSVDLELRSSANNNLDGFAGVSKDIQGTVVIRYNLFRGGADFAAIYQARERANASHFREANAVREIKEAIASVWNTLHANRIRNHQNEIRVQTAIEVTKAYNQQFSLGKRSLLNLLDTERELFSAKSDLVNSRFDVYRDSYNLFSKMGVLVPILLK